MTKTTPHKFAPKRTPELEAKARALRSQGMSWRDIGKAIGVNPTSVHEWCDDEYRDYKRGRRQELKRTDKPEAIRRPYQGKTWKEFRPDDRHLPKVPPDTRDLTARMLGDPLPGRSALDKRHGA